jgi:hypothetical protein
MFCLSTISTSGIYLNRTLFFRVVLYSAHLAFDPHLYLHFTPSNDRVSNPPNYSVILASLHVCVPSGTSLVQWERIEQTLQYCFQAYGISHVTISPELQRSESQSLSKEDGGCVRLSSRDDIGCSVNELKKRRMTGGV